MQALRRIAAGPQLILDLAGHKRLSSSGSWTLRIEAPVRRAPRGAARPLNRPLAAFAGVPAGTYRLTVTRHGAGEGLLMAGVGNDQFAIVTQPIAAFDAGLELHLPAGARMLTVRADESARDELDGVALQLVAIDRAPQTRDAARRAVRYEGGIAFFLDDRSFPEPSGFWVGGRRETRVVLLPDAGRAVVSMVLRNSGADNIVTLDAGGREEDIALTPGEERRVELPLERNRGSALVRIRSSAGVRPSEHDPGSRDSRLLGVYVMMR
jgi:hypothetical protein